MKGFPLGWREVYRRCMFAGFLCCVSPGVVLAAEYGYSLEYLTQYSNNTTLAGTNEPSDWINIGRAILYRNDPTAQTLRSNIFMDVRYEDYYHDTVEDRTLLTLNANLAWLLIPERLTWVVEDYYGQTFRNILQPGAPSNQQNVNVFSTGPDATLRLTPVSSLLFSLRAGNYSAEEDATNLNQDSNRYFGRAGWLYTASTTTNLSLNYDVMRREFDDTATNTDYDLHNAYVRLESRRTSRSTVSLDAGKSRVVSNDVDIIDRGLVRAQYLRKITADSNLRISANSQVTDNTTAILSSGGVNLVTTPIGTSGNSYIYHIKEVDTSFERRRDYGTDFLRLFAQRQNYEIALLDQDRAGAYLDVAFGLTSTLTGSVFGSYVYADYIDQSLNDRDGLVGLRLAYRARQKVVFGFDLRKLTRYSSDSARDYDETRVGLSVAYRSALYRNETTGPFGTLY